MKTKNTRENISLIDSTLAGKSKIVETIRGIYINKTLRAGIELELFTLLAKGALSGEEIKTHLSLHGRGLDDFLDTFVGLGILSRDGNGKDARYSNTEEVSLFLVKDSPQYIGDVLEYKMREIEQYWGELPRALKTGRPQRQDIKDTGKDLFQLNYDSTQKRKRFIGGMNLGQMASFKEFIKKFDFSAYQTLCDIGGANALFSILVALEHQHMKLFTFDLPALEPITREKIADSGLSDRITVVKGNFFENEFPKADVITMGNILHDWNLEEKKLLMGKAYDAIPPGGALVVIESLIDNQRKENIIGLLMSLHMLLVTEGGFDFTAADFDGWAREIGFEKTVYMPLSSESNAIIAYK